MVIKPKLRPVKPRQFAPRSDSFKLRPSESTRKERISVQGIAEHASKEGTLVHYHLGKKSSIPLHGTWDTHRHNRYGFIKELGRGGFGKVILVEHASSGQLLTLKRVRPMDTFALSGEERLSLQHPFIVQLMGSFISRRENGDQDRVLLFEFCDGPMFSAFMRRVPEYVKEHAAFFAAQLVLCLKHLDYARVVHRDVKPDNILIVKGGYLKLADFGLATRSFDFACLSQDDTY